MKLREHIKPPVWSFKTNWSRLPGMLFWSGLVVAMANLYFNAKQYPNAEFVPIITWVLYMPYLLLGLRDSRRTRKELKDKVFELRVQTILLETLAQTVGDESMEHDMKKMKENLRKLA